MIRIALAGNPNSGKTTLFNELTGASQYVGNWPGVTVEKKEGKLRKHKDVMIMDLPGIYSLSPYTLEEVISRDYLIQDQPDVIINIVDGTNLERNLYLTTQLLELNIPMVLALNMMDLVNKRGETIDKEELSNELGIPVVEISALKSQNTDALVQKTLQTAARQQKPQRKFSFTENVETLLKKIEKEYEDKISSNPRWYAVKLFEQDPEVLKDIELKPETKQEIEALEDSVDDDAESIVTNQRYDWISQIVSRVQVKKDTQKLTTSDKIDRVVTNRWLAFPIFIAIIYAVYYISIVTVGTAMTDFVNDVVVAEWIQEPLAAFLEGAGVSAFWNGMLVDGIIGGVGAVLGFLPQMITLFLLLAILEQCGYMARIAFILDRIFRKFGLSGKSFIPMLIGTGCSIPGIMASRTIENDADRKMTIITTSFMPCSAKLPIIGLIAGALFPGKSWVAPSAYFVGIGAIIISGIILKKTKGFAGDPAPFVMELPEYHLPTVKGVLKSVWERASSFAKKAGTIILLSSIFIYCVSVISFRGGFHITDDITESLIAQIGGFFAPLFAPLGFGDWQSTTATAMGLVAKENVVSNFGIIYGIGEEALDFVEAGEFSKVQAIASHFTQLSGYSFLIFNLLCAPCFAAVGAIRREMGNEKWTWFAITYQTVFAYAISLIVYQLGNLFVNGVFGVWTVVAFVVLAGLLYLLFRPDPNKKRLMA